MKANPRSLATHLSRAFCRPLLAAAVLLFGTLAAPARAGLIYGSAYVGNFDSSNLYTINSTNGASTLVGNIGFYMVSGMDFDSGVLYGVGKRTSDSANVLLSINTATGAGTQIGTLGIGGNVTDISFRADHTLFANAAGNIYTINTTSGAATLVGATGANFQGNSLAFSNSGTLYYINGNRVETINQTTGAATNGPLMNWAPLANGLARSNAMDYDLSTNSLYASVVDTSGGGAPSWLATIDVSTGGVSYLGQTERGMDAIAIDSIAAVPEPGSALFGIACIGAAIFRRRPRTQADSV